MNASYYFSLLSGTLCVCRGGGGYLKTVFIIFFHLRFQEFVTNKNWLHLDIAGVMSNKGEVPYLGKGMAGIKGILL